MLDLSKRTVSQKSARFAPDKFEDQYEAALIDLINQKRAGKPIVGKERPRGENVVDLMESLRGIDIASPSLRRSPELDDKGAVVVRADDHSCRRAHRQRSLPKSSSASRSRFTAGAFGLRVSGRTRGIAAGHQPVAVMLDCCC
jgi:hypothetical protein